MIWLKRTFNYGALWAADQDRFAAMQMSLAANGTDDYTKVLMVVDDDGTFTTEDVYLLLPAPYGHLFTGYETCDAPARAKSLLVGNQTEFFRQFPVHVSPAA